MARCIDWPCCGHENGCCPDYDEGGRQMNMVCTCGAKLPINNRYSICDACLKEERDWDDDSDRYDDYDHDDEEDCEDCWDVREDFGDWGIASMMEE